MEKKGIVLIVTLLLSSFFLFAQEGSPSPYYTNFDWTATGMNLKASLAAKIRSTHTNILSYSDVEKSILVTDLDPTDDTDTNLLLLYGFSDDNCNTSSSNDKDHRTRDKILEDNGRANPCLWNREHTYPKALGTPNLGTSGAGADAHHIRSADKKRNADRDNDQFFNGNGVNSYEIGTTWYPGDEWKGDVARMMMYLYLRYPTQCLPSNVGIGSNANTPDDMIDLFLNWNAEDPVSEYEDNRNTYHGNTSNRYAQGNRNPFIDNPYLATVIWGGPEAQNRWPDVFLSTKKFDFTNAVAIYPNPSSNGSFTITSKVSLQSITLYTINGQIIQQIQNPTTSTIQLKNISSGFYFVQLQSAHGNVIKKVIVN